MRERDRYFVLFCESGPKKSTLKFIGTYPNIVGDPFDMKPAHHAPIVLQLAIPLIIVLGKQWDWVGVIEKFFKKKFGFLME